MRMMAHREIRVAPGRELLMAEMRAFEYLPDGRFRRMDARAGQHDDAAMPVALYQPALIITHEPIGAFRWT
jgi:hypothetical protein